MQQTTGRTLSTRIIILATVSIAITGAVLWYLPATRFLVTAAIMFVETSGLYVLAAAVVLVFVLALSFARSATIARNRKRELDEYMRVVQQTASDVPRSFKKELVDAIPENGPDLGVNEPITVSEPIQLKVIPGGKDKKQLPVKAQISTISDDLFFQPVTNVSAGQIIGYEIFRQARQVARQEPIFIQHYQEAGELNPAEFEYSTLEKAAAATDHEMWSEITQRNQISFFVQASEALLDDKTLWRRTAAILRKKSKSNPSITLSVCSSALANAPKKTINERLLKLKRLQNSDVRLALSGFKHDQDLVTQEQLEQFCLIRCCKEELLSCYAGEATTDTMLAYQQISNLSLDIVVQGIVSETDLVDCMAAGAKFMSGDYIAPPRKLKSDTSVDTNAAE